jgi:hypothetical protein
MSYGATSSLSVVENDSGVCLVMRGAVYKRGKPRLERMSEEVDALRVQIVDAFFLGSKLAIPKLRTLKEKNEALFELAINSEYEPGVRPIELAFKLDPEDPEDPEDAEDAEEAEEAEDAEDDDRFPVSDLGILRDEFGVKFSFESGKKNLISVVLEAFETPRVSWDDVLGMVEKHVQEYEESDVDGFEQRTLDWLDFLIGVIGLKPLDSAYEVLLRNQTFFGRPAILNKILDKGGRAKFEELARRENKNDRIGESQLFKFFEATVSREEVERYLDPPVSSATFLQDLSGKYEKVHIDTKDRNPGICLRGGLVTKLAEPPRPSGIGVVACKQFKIETPEGFPAYDYWLPVMWTTWTEEVAALLFGKTPSSVPRVFADKGLKAWTEAKLANQSATGLTFLDMSGKSFKAIAALGTHSKWKYVPIPDDVTPSAPTREADGTLIVKGEWYPNFFKGVEGDGGGDDTMQKEMSKAIVMRNFVRLAAARKKFLPEFPLGFTRGSRKRPVMEAIPTDIHVDFHISGKPLSPLLFVS